MESIRNFSLISWQFSHLKQCVINLCNGTPGRLYIRSIVKTSDFEKNVFLKICSKTQEKNSNSHNVISHHSKLKHIVCVFIEPNHVKSFSHMTSTSPESKLFTVSRLKSFNFWGKIRPSCENSTLLSLSQPLIQSLTYCITWLYQSHLSSLVSYIRV